MPEGPEIAIMRKQLNHEFSGLTLNKITLLNNYKKIKEHSGLPMKLNFVKSKGKLLIFDFGDTFLLVHFMLTGHFSLVPQKYTRCIFEFTDNDLTKKLYFNDPRKLGTFKWCDHLELKSELSALGPSIIKIKEKEFINAFNIKSKVSIGAALHDQSKVCGIGNYLRAEVLFKAKISPLRPCNELSVDEIKKIYECLVGIVDKILKKGGTSDYADLYDHYGKYNFKAYGVAKNKTKISGQTMYWDDTIQK